MVPVFRDLKTATRVARNLLRSRRTRKQLANRRDSFSPQEPGSIQIAVYFADTKVNLYQLRQWYAPLAELAKTWPVAIISRAPGAALRLIDEAPVPVLYLRKVADLENFV